MPEEEQQGNAAGARFTQGDIGPSLMRLQNLIQAGLDDFAFDHYREAYNKIAFSGTTGALDALGKQQTGDTADPKDPVNVFRFATDAWFYSAVEMWDGIRDLTNQYFQDLSNYAGRHPTPPPAKKAKSTTKKSSPRKPA